MAQGIRDDGQEFKVQVAAKLVGSGIQFDENAG